MEKALLLGLVLFSQKRPHHLAIANATGQVELCRQLNWIEIKIGQTDGDCVDALCLRAIWPDRIQKRPPRRVCGQKLGRLTGESRGQVEPI